MAISRFSVRLRGSALVALVSAAAAVALHAAEPSRTQRAVREQVVRVVVADKDYAPVKLLTARDLTVREDGVAREILKVEAASAPLTAAILADDSQAAQAISAELRPALKALIPGLLAGTPDSEVALTTFGERPTKVADFTKLTAMLMPAVDKVFPRSGAGAYFTDAVMETSGALARKEVARRTIVGIVVESGPEFSSATRERVEAALKQGRVSLWTLVLQGSTVGFTIEQRTRAEVTIDVAAASGGLARTVISPMGLESAARSMGVLIASEYNVTYARPESLIPPKDRQVSSSLPGARVMASRWITP